MNLDTLNRDELFRELVELAKEEGVTSQEMWNELVDELLDSHLNIGEMDKDQDLEGLKVQLNGMWEEYKREAAPESSAAISEDPEAPAA
ncbi:MAG: hypothetical protein ABIO72_04125 [Patescibacteria group bacterium]